METGKQGLDTQVGGTGKDGPVAISKPKVLDTLADEVTSEEYIGDSEPGFGFTHGDANRRDTVLRSRDENESFSSCKTEFVESELYTEKTITEVSSKLITCYKAGSCYVIKDICVDDSKQSEEKYLQENYDSKEKLCTGLTQLDLDAEDGLSKNLVGKMTPLVKCGIGSISTLETDKVLKFSDSGKGRPKDGDVEELISDAAGHSYGSTIPSNQVEGQVATVRMDFANEKDSEGKKEHLQSMKCSKEQMLQFSSKIGNKSITFTFDPSISAPSFNNGGDMEEEKAAALATGRQPEHHHVHSLAELCLEERISSGEPTFSMGSSCHVPETMVGTQGRNLSSDPDVSEKLQTELHSTSASITFSGPVQYSGSISLRSDSSTTSARSFAFPVLQSEWNSSPVRMAKADARQFRKHRWWRMSLLCCRF